MWRDDNADGEMLADRAVFQKTRLLGSSKDVDTHEAPEQ